MDEWPVPSFCTLEAVPLVGTMAIYDSQAAVAEGVPRQWRAFRLEHPSLGEQFQFYGASPCTDDRKIHYLTGIVEQGTNTLANADRLTLEAGEYAVVRVDGPERLRDTWIWLLGTWLPSSGRCERHAPEFEKFSGISETGAPVGAVELWIPLEP
jgi:AraC family transcriptional regulator